VRETNEREREREKKMINLDWNSIGERNRLINEEKDRKIAAKVITLYCNNMYCWFVYLCEIEREKEREKRQGLSLNPSCNGNGIVYVKNTNGFLKWQPNQFTTQKQHFGMQQVWNEGSRHIWSGGGSMENLRVGECKKFVIFTTDLLKSCSP